MSRISTPNTVNKTLPVNERLLSLDRSEWREHLREVALGCAIRSDFLVSALYERAGVRCNDQLKSLLLELAKNRKINPYSVSM
jgi:hypothetical protein